MINFNDKKNRKVVSIVLIAVVILLIVAMVPVSYTHLSLWGTMSIMPAASRDRSLRSAM